MIKSGGAECGTQTWWDTYHKD